MILPPDGFIIFCLYLPRRQINQEIKDDAVHFLLAFVSLSERQPATLKIAREGQNTGELPASDRNPAQDAVCILIRLQGKAGGGVWVVATPAGAQTT